MTLKTRSRFHTTLSKVKDTICVLINQKISDFIDLSEIDYMPAAVSRSASQPLQELTLYLTTIFESILARVPGDIRNIFYFSTCERLAGVFRVCNNKKKYSKPHTTPHNTTSFLFLTFLPFSHLGHADEPSSEKVQRELCGEPSP